MKEQNQQNLYEIIRNHFAEGVDDNREQYRHEPEPYDDDDTDISNSDKSEEESPPLRTFVIPCNYKRDEFHYSIDAVIGGEPVEFICDTFLNAYWFPFSKERKLYALLECDARYFDKGDEDTDQTTLIIEEKKTVEHANVKYVFDERLLMHSSIVAQEYYLTRLSTLDIQQIQFIVNSQDLPRTVTSPKEAWVAFDDDHLPFAFSFLKPFMSSEMRFLCLELLANMGNNPRSKDNTRRLRHLLSPAMLHSSVQLPPLNLARREIVDSLNMSISGYDEVKEQIARTVIAEEYNGVAPSNILFIGPPGVGKTEFAHALAKVLNRPIVDLDCGDKDAVLLWGVDSKFEDADFGELHRKTFQLGEDADYACFVLDEVDKLVTNEHCGDPYDGFKRLANEHELYDHYLGIPQSLPYSFIIACANDEDKLPDSFVNRFQKRYRFKRYSTQQKVKVLMHKLPQLISENLRCKVSFTEGAMYLLSGVSTDEGARDTIEGAKAALEEAACILAEGQSEFVEINVDFLMNHDIFTTLSRSEVKKKYNYLRAKYPDVIF